MPPTQRTPDEQFTELKRIIRADAGIQATLTACKDQMTWVNQVVQVAKDSGINISPDDVISRIKARLNDALDSESGIDLINVAGHSPGTAHTSPF